MSVNDDVINSCHLVISQVTLTLGKAIQTMENRQILEDWLNLIWQDVGRHLLDIELKFMSLTIDILVDVISTKTPFPSAFMLEKAMPILFHNFQPTKKAGVLFFMAKLLKDSADAGQSRHSGLFCLKFGLFKIQLFLKFGYFCLKIGQFA